jgi:hypothetical protein
MMPHGIIGDRQIIFVVMRQRMRRGRRDRYRPQNDELQASMLDILNHRPTRVTFVALRRLPVLGPSSRPSLSKFEDADLRPLSHPGLSEQNRACAVNLIKMATGSIGEVPGRAAAIIRSTSI